MAIAPPLALLLELSHRCPLKCPYCYNPLKLTPRSKELDTDTWLRVLNEAAGLGILQVHFSGGEPALRDDLEVLVEAADQLGIYTNLITSTLLLGRERIRDLARRGLQHIQISFQDVRPDAADAMAGYSGAHATKIAAAQCAIEVGLPVTMNTVITRRNIERLESIIEFALTIGARRLEIANVQYYGWALKNRAALMPTRVQIENAVEIVRKMEPSLAGRLAIDFVAPDYYARRPKPCMGGWAQKFMNITPAGDVLPCHAAETIPGIKFETVLRSSLKDIWETSESFDHFRGHDWMVPPCRDCDQKSIDWGGCRCQALALTGDARNADPACALSPFHEKIVKLAEADALDSKAALIFRGGIRA